ncbi:hypothetical protein VB716_07595 [Synechococcus sp. CCY9201]|nr:MULTISPECIES: hypothetical protein [unclassified Synechococcus]MEA5474085.1 hypothetical protein [Synechococcus sp. CCY9201]
MRSAYKWLARFGKGGNTALADQWNVRHAQRQMLDPQE